MGVYHGRQSVLDVTAGVEIIGYGSISESILTFPDVVILKSTFETYLQDAAGGPFRCRLSFRNIGEIHLHWQPFHLTAGVADILYDSVRLVQQTLLLLSGRDSTADDAAVRSMLASRSRAGDPLELPSRIADAPRPLAVCFSTSPAWETEMTVDLVRWTFGDAFFRWTESQLS